MLLDLRIKARLHSWGNMHATSRSQFPPLVSHGLRSRFRFASTPLHLSYLCRSQSLAVSLFQLCHQAVTRSTPFHIYLLLHLLFLSVSLCLIVFLLSILQSHWSHFFFLPLAHLMHFPQHPHFYLLLPVSHFVPVSLLSGSFFVSCTFHLTLYLWKWV